MERFGTKQRINLLLGKYKYPVLVALVGLGLMLLPTGSGQEAAEPVSAEPVQEVGLERRLEEILSAVEGAGAVTVLLTEERGREVVYQTDSQSRSDGTQTSRTDDTVLLEGSDRTESGLVRQTLEPKYRGAVVLCQGADQSAVRLAIVQAVRCVTGLGADEITVLKRK